MRHKGGAYAFLEGLPLNKKLVSMSVILLLPFIIMTIFLLYQLNQVYSAYDAIVQNVTRINSYNIAFKEEMDAVTYQMVARSMHKNEVESELGMKDPDRMITDAETELENRKDLASTNESRDSIRSIIKLLITLRKRVNDIDATVQVSGFYEENMSRLDMDIHIITELIQEKISEYIYYETQNMDALHKGIEEYRLRLMNTTVVMVVLVLVLAFLLSFMITRSITRPIQSLCRVTERVGRGDLSLRAENVAGKNEIATLNKSFNSMIEEIGQLIQHIRDEERNIRALELKLLQAQINPHFLYNTLDNILWLSEDGQKEDVAEIVTSLSSFFRTTLSGGRDFIHISEEISHIEAYLRIQKLRYRDILSYHIELPAGLRDCLILKMALQPVVENALYHGIKNKRGMGHIAVSVAEDDGGIALIVEDDGIGMKEEELERLRRLAAGAEAPQGDNKGFGIANVAERLKLNYGEGYGLSFKSVYGEGTRVVLKIPKVCA